MTHRSPFTVDIAPSAEVRIEITSDLIQQFAALTGDRSSLHVSKAFARRSAFRRPVAHGMLPIAFLPLTQPFNVSGFRSVLNSIDGRFLAPVFAGDALRLAVAPTKRKGSSREQEFSYEIQHAESRAVATRGSFSVSYEPQGAQQPGSAAGSGPMVTDAEDVAHLQFEDVKVGAGDETDFSISSATIRDFAALVQSGIRTEDLSTDNVASACDLPNLLALMLFSTSLGVRLPGASATFLEFSARFEHPVALNTPYRLRGTVTHRSSATRIIRKEMLIAAPDAGAAPVVRGKVAALVAKPAASMPSIEQLATSIDWGLRGKVVVVTGASRGIGETTAKLLSLLGARVVVNYYHGAEDARRVVEEIESFGGEAVAIAADVSDRDQVRSLVQKTRDRFGAIHVLVNNAARDARPIPFLKLTWDEIQKDLDVVAKGAFLCCQEVIPLMIENGGGKIINISTVATDNPPPDQTKYVMAKSALVGLTRSLSIEFAAQNIQVNLVVPNFVETDFVAHIQDSFRKKIAQDTPMRRNATPIDVARAVAFLASSLSSFTTGQKLMVTGGGPPYA